MKSRTPDELRKRMRDLEARIGRCRFVKRKYSEERERIFKELAILEYGMPGDSVSFHGANRKLLQGTITGFSDSFSDDRIICLIKVQGDFVSYETHISNPKDLVRS